jgi:UDP-N-acetylglucosamine:LPS N-acetylglucosamine transferase/uncharacterized radical SAM superfamily protein
METKRLLVLSSNTAGGHRYAGEAIAAVARAFSPQGEGSGGPRYEAELIDALDRFGKPLARSMLKVYPWIARHAPWIWGPAFRLTNGRRRYGVVERIGLGQMKADFPRWLREYGPDAVVSVYPHLGPVVAKALAEAGLDVPFIVAVTDLETAHASWFHPRVDQYLVPTEEYRLAAIRRGVPIGKIAVTGLPVRSSFAPSEAGAKAGLKAALGLDPGAPMVLATGGETGHGMERLARAYGRLERPGFTLVAACGRHERLHERLLALKAGGKAGTGLLPIGFTDRMDRYVAAADLVIGKAGASTVMEAMHCGVPILVTGKIPGQEDGNVSRVLRFGSGAFERSPGRVMRLAVSWLADPALMAAMGAKAASMACPGAAGEAFSIIRRWILAPRPIVARKGGASGASRRKVLFISSSPYKNDGTVLKRGRLWFPALTLPVLASLAPPHWEAEIVYEMIEEIPWDTDADLVALGGIGLGLQRSMDIADRYRSMGKTVVIGGIMASLAPEKAAPHADSLVLGEAEDALPEMFADFEAGRLKPEYRSSRPPSLIGTPVPRYDLVRAKKTGWWLPAQIGRGCPHRCDFCSVASVFHGGYRPREIGEIVRDVRAIKALGYDKVFFVDDNIAADPDFCLEVMRELIKEKIQWVSQCALTVVDHPELMDAMARSGCITLSFGLESINQGSLDSVSKTFTTVQRYRDALRVIRSHGIEISTEMMVGLDGDTAEVFDDMLEFLLEERIALPRVFVLTPVPGTPLFDQYNREGRIFEENLYRYSATKSVFHPRLMTAAELDSGYWRLNDRLFSYPGILRRIAGPGMRMGLVHMAFLIVSNLSYRQSVKDRLCPGIV